MSSYEDEIALLAEDIRRYTNNDGRVDVALTQLLKVYEAEVQALAFEAIELERALVRQTTEIEGRRIAAAQPQGRWRNHG
jgi:hypothetical protein